MLKLGEYDASESELRWEWCDQAISELMLLENIKEVRLTSKNDFPAKRKASNIEKDFFNYAESEVEQDESFTTKCDAEAELNQYLASAKGCDDVLR